MSYIPRDTESVYPANPVTTRGISVKLGSDPKHKDDSTSRSYANGRTVWIRDISNPSASQAYTQHTQPVTVAKFSPSGYYCASGDASGTVRVWDTVGSDQVLKSEVKVIAGRINDLSWDGESKRIIAVGDGKERFGHAFLFDSGSSCGELTGHSKVVNSVTIRHQRPFRAVTCSDDTTLVFYTGVPFKYSTTIRSHSRFVQDVRYSPIGEAFASAGSDGKVFLYDGTSGEKKGELIDGDGAHKGTVFAIDWDKAGKKLVSSGADAVVKIWDVESGKVAAHWNVEEDGAPAVNTQQVGNVWMNEGRIASLSFSGNINLIDPRAPGQISQVLYGAQKSITSLSYSRPSKTFYTGSYDGRINSFSDVGAGGVCRPVKGMSHTNQVIAMDVDPESGVWSAGMDDSLKEIKGEEFTSTSAGTGGLPKGLSTSKASGSSTVFLLNATEVLIFQKAKKVGSLKLPFSGSAIDAAKEKNLVAVGGETLERGRGWCTSCQYPAGWECLGGELTNNLSPITSLAFSPDASLLAAGEQTGKIMLYDVAGMSDAGFFHTARVQAISWSPEGTHCASGSLDTCVYVWSVERPMKNIPIKNVHPAGVTGVQWIDGIHIASTGADGSLKTFEIKHH
ncbi:WD40 repeat-like protein [Atractiella rhizophila]|nr:WD40 repeat-like protein [Atractiella rhizophila]